MHRTLKEIQTLEPAVDYERIVYLMATHEFPFDTTRALEFALFRTYAVPAIGCLLAHTREFIDRTQKRYDDTDLILSEIVENYRQMGYEVQVVEHPAKESADACNSCFSAGAEMGQMYGDVYIRKSGITTGLEDGLF